MEYVEYLVIMTTHVPDGTADDAVDAMRTREAARARELAALGHLLRLWRPPLRPGEWRTLGLFVAHDDDELEQVLSSMPLRVWRTDEVMRFAPHPNDPPPTATNTRLDESANAIEFLTTFTMAIPPGAPDHLVEAMKAREAQRAGELADDGHLLRLWMPAGAPHGPRAFGLWRARDAEEMQTIMESLPLYAWMRVDTTSLSLHPSDPGTSRVGHTRVFHRRDA